MDTVDKATRSRIMASIRYRGNRSTELKLRMLLVRAGISGWTLLPGDLIGNPDFVFPTIRLVVFVDGCFWHGCPRCGHTPGTNKKYWTAKLQRTKVRDKRQRAKLRRDGWSVLSIWEHELVSSGKVLARVQRAIRRRGGGGLSETGACHSLGREHSARQ